MQVYVNELLKLLLKCQYWNGESGQQAEIEMVWPREEEGRAMRKDVPGRKLLGRNKKSWRRCIEEDIDLDIDLEIEEGTAENRDEWRKAIARLTP